MKTHLLNNYPQYKLFDFGYAHLVVHEKHLDSFIPLYCEFAKSLDDATSDKLKKAGEIGRVFQRVKSLGCEGSF